MERIGGNITAIIQTKNEGTKNEIGEYKHRWTDAYRVKGWLDLSGGDSKHTTYNSKIQESTHIFICDCELIETTPENARMMINGQIYSILLIDDPMNLHQHMEIYLKYTGGQSG